jgi:hypothetical protein
MVEVENTARQHGHSVGSWYRRSERIWITSCRHCERMGWIIQPGPEPWRMGGPLTEEPCEEK